MTIKNPEALIKTTHFCEAYEGMTFVLLEDSYKLDISKDAILFVTGNCIVNLITAETYSFRDFGEEDIIREVNVKLLIEG